MSAADVKQLQRRTTGKFVFDSKTAKGTEVWCSIAPSVKVNPDLLYAKCVILGDSTASKLKVREVETGEKATFECKPDDCFIANEPFEPSTYPDIGLMPYTSIPCVLDFLKCRFMCNLIYTTADPLLVAINPFKDVGLISDQIVMQYRDVADVAKLPPHVFSVARTAFDNLHTVGKSQSILVSGESGAGKTEATKHIMKFFASSKSGTMDLRIQKAVMAANPVLEAFGNAKTVRNNNSSRFGRFMQLQLGRYGGIEYGMVKNFLLEKSRVLTQDSEERNYHIFYQLLKGVENYPELKEKLKLKKMTEYKYINPACLNVESIDDVKEFDEVLESLKSMGLTDKERENVFSIVSGVLLLGNVELEAEDVGGGVEGAKIKDASYQSFRDAMELLFLDADEIERELKVKITVAGKNTVEGRWRLDEAQILKDSLAKALYDKLFDWIILTLNKKILPENGFNLFMGMLDIFGFEVFKNNSLEQLFINITNEWLQKNFTDIVFEREQNLYRNEGISAANLVFKSNAQIIETLCGKKNSILSVLEDQCLVPNGGDEKFVSGAMSTLKNDVLKKSKIGSDINFFVAHTVGDIQYCAAGFIFKNKDVLRAELVEVVQRSPNNIIKALFEGLVVEKGKIAKGQLIGSQFMNSLNMLMEIINQTEPHFVRCIKPNETKLPLDWVASKILIQLHSLSILEAMQLRNLGYSYRRTFKDFLFQFKYANLKITSDTRTDPKLLAEMLMNDTGIAKEDGWAIGKTMIFLSKNCAKNLAYKQREKLAVFMPLVEKLEAVWSLYKYRKEFKAQKLPKLLRVQAQLRRILDVEICAN